MLRSAIGYVIQSGLVVSATNHDDKLVIANDEFDTNARLRLTATSPVANGSTLYTFARTSAISRRTPIFRGLFSRHLIPL